MSARTIWLGDEQVQLTEQPLEADGDGLIYQIEGRADHLVKIYREPPDPSRERRLRRMLTLPPPGGSAVTPPSPPELAWPVALAMSHEDSVIGYVRQRFAEPDYTRLSRMLAEPRLDWQFRLGVSWNLAFMVARLHHAGFVIGNLSSRNVVVDRDGFVTFLESDSITFTDPETGEQFPGFTQSADAPAGKADDDFALALLIRQLLEGGDSPNTPPGTLDPIAQHPALTRLLTAASDHEAEEPARHPTADDWLRALDQERSRAGRRHGRRPTARQRVWHAFLDGFGRTFDLFGATSRVREPLPTFESVIADDVHELCLALGLTADDKTESGR